MIIFRSSSIVVWTTPSNPLESGLATGTGRLDSSVRARFFGNLLSGDYGLSTFCDTCGVQPRSRQPATKSAVS